MMAREKRETRAFNMKMDIKLAERLERFCEESGQSKTTAVERALAVYMDDFERQQAILKQHDDKN